MIKTLVYLIKQKLLEDDCWITNNNYYLYFYVFINAFMYLMFKYLRVHNREQLVYTFLLYIYICKCLYTMGTQK